MQKTSRILFSFCLFLGMFGMSHCTPNKDNTESDLPPSIAAALINTDTDTQGPLYLNPAEAAITIQKDVQQAPSLLFDGLKVPTLSINFQNADYVQILRCAASFQFKTQDGTLVENTLINPSNQNTLQWAWTLAWNQHNACEVVTNMSPAISYPDIAAPTGRFYYILNPCISKIHSVTNLDACSYLVQVTRTFSYTNVFQAEVQRKAVDLSNALSSLTAFMSQVNILAKNLSISITDCENFVAQRDRMQKLRAGFSELAIFVGIVVIGFAFGGGIMFLFYADMAAMLGAMLMEQFKVFKETGNQCATGLNHDLEEKFNVTNIYNQLQNVLNTSISQTRLQIQNLMDEMNKYDNRILNYNQGIQKLKTMGVDVTDATSVQSAVTSAVAAGVAPGAAAAAASVQ